MYITSFYFTVETITSVGYGDFKPVSVIEKVFLTITMIIGIGMFSVANGTITSILQAADTEKAKFE